MAPRSTWMLALTAAAVLGAAGAWHQHGKTWWLPHLRPASKIFVVGVLSGVHAIDLKTGKIGPAVNTGVLPHNLALSGDGKHLFVTNVGSQSVSVIDVATEQKVRDILVGEVPDNEPHRKLGAERMARVTSCVECHKTNAIGSLPNALSWAPDGRTLMVNEIRNRSVTLLDVDAGKTLRQVTFEDLPTPAAPANMVVNPANREVWVLHRFEAEDYRKGEAKELGAKHKDDFQHDAPAGQHVSWVTVHDRDLTKQLARIKMDYAVPFDAVFSPAGDFLYVGYRSTNRIAVFDTRTRAVARTIETDVAPTGLSLSPDGKKLYVTCLHSHPPVVQVIDAATGHIDVSMGVPPSPSLVVTDPATGYIYVTTTGYNAVLEIDPVNRKLLREFPAGHQPLALLLVH